MFKYIRPIRSIRGLHQIKHSSETIGHVLDKFANNPRPSTLEPIKYPIAAATAPPPPGYNILRSKYSSEMDALVKFVQAKGNEIKSHISKSEAMDILEEYISGSSKINKIHSNLTPKQRQLLKIAAAKANKGIRKEDYAIRGIIGLYMKRNWLVWNYTLSNNGIHVAEDTETGYNFSIIDSEEDFGDSNWEEGSENENEREVRKDKEAGVKQKNEAAAAYAGHNDGGYVSMLKRLGKVHRSSIVHVLPQMTMLQAHPTINHAILEEKDIDRLQNFLTSANETSKYREELVFRAKTNYELTKSMMDGENTLIRGDFFYPECIPGTQIHLNDILFRRCIALQDSLRVKDPMFAVMVYQDGSSSVLDNADGVVWDGEIENVFTMFPKLKSPQSFQKNFVRFVSRGWIPVLAREKEIVMVKSKQEYYRQIIKKLAIGGLSIGVTVGTASYYSGFI